MRTVCWFLLLHCHFHLGKLWLPLEQYYYFCSGRKERGRGPDPLPWSPVIRPWIIYQYGICEGDVECVPVWICQGVECMSIIGDVILNVTGAERAKRRCELARLVANAAWTQWHVRPTFCRSKHLRPPPPADTCLKQGLCGKSLLKITSDF